MRPERWRQVREVFDNAIALSGDERAAYLSQVCSDDVELHAEVKSLLRSHQDAGSVFLKNPAVDLRSLMPDAGSAASRVGLRIGVYQIAEEIGRGGMGEVYRAVRADGQYDKQVAIKLVRVGFDTSFVLERFRHERQILASLDHPNVAHLYDGGTTEDSAPYLVMELIDGTPIDQYCENHQLGIPDRLLLFNQVCSAVQYAHQRLVIHRDIKPNNILVTTEGIPKLLDFGIAKILDPSSGAETTLVRSMTPEYASPEQIRGEPITTATDVYSLGVVLYKLLTGRSPYPGETRTPLEFANAVCEVEPARPSTIRMPLNSTDNKYPQTKASENYAKVKRALRGDLDNIVLKALRKEPERRYSSVEQLAEDIRRHLKGLPVTAMKGSFRYRASKFARRNRVVMVAGIMVAITLIAGIWATIRQARIARRQADIASTERARAERRFGDVRELANSLIFEIHDSIQGLPGATPSRKLLLDRAVQYLDKLSQDSAGDVSLQRELAWAYQRLATVQGDTSQSNLGEVGAAQVSNQKAMALFEAVAKANPDSLTDQLNLAMAYRGRAFFDIYETSGLAEINRALAITEPLMRNNANSLDLKNERAQEYFILANIQDAMGDRLLAIDSFRKVLDLRQEILSTKPTYPDIRHGVAKVTVLLAHEMGRFGSRDEALRLMNMGIAEFQGLVKATGGDPGIVRELSTAEGRRGEVELMQGDIAAARADFHDARHRIERLARLDPENKMLQSDLWAAQFTDGRALAVAGRNAEALPVLERAFQGYRALHLEAEVWPGSPLMEAWIGEAQAGTNKFAQALKSYEAAAAGLVDDESRYDDARCDLAMVETKIGNTLVRMGKSRDAATHFGRALDTAKLSVSLEHNDFPALNAAAEAYAGEGDLAEFEARNSANEATRSKLRNDACTSYKQSLSIWKHISNPGRINGNGYLSGNSGQIAQRLASCNDEPAH
jgi:eukaryotic-like serine/threonine-protein kinase